MPERRGAVAIDAHLTCGFLICRSLVTSVSPGTSCSRCSSVAAPWYSASMSELCRVNWYWLFELRPPMLIAGGFWTKTRMPGHRGQLPGQ